MNKKYELMYLDYDILPINNDIADIINNHINNKEMMREYFLIWSFKTPDTNKIVIRDKIFNINEHIRELKTKYKNSLTNGKKPNIYDLISFIFYDYDIDRDEMPIKVNNKIVCRFFNINQNKKIKRYIRQRDEYALFYKIMLKCILLQRIKGYKNGSFEFELNFKRYYDIIKLHQQTQNELLHTLLGH